MTGSNNDGQWRVFEPSQEKKKKKKIGLSQPNKNFGHTESCSKHRGFKQSAQLHLMFADVEK
jgi:hypothetical protein